MRVKNKEIVNLKRRLKAAGVKGLALDVDDTLSSTLMFVVEKLLKDLGNPEKLTALEITKKYGHTDRIPYWKGEDANKVIEEVILVNEKQKEIPLIENSSKTASEINKIIPIVAYVTVRPTSILHGTKFWLKKHGFPEATIITKADKINRKKGNKWKAGVLKYLYPEVIGIVDDNPGLTKYLKKGYKGIVFLYGGAESKNDSINVIPCEDWETVAKKVKECKL